MTAMLVIVACAPLPPTSQAPPPTSTTEPATPPAPATAPAPMSPQAGRGNDATRTLRGRVSLYGSEFAGRKTASGETFDPDALTMAHRTLPFGTRVRVTNLENQRSVEVVVNDRGPAVAGRIADLSRAAAARIGMIADGVVDALLEVLPGPR
jgi:rare lipoprotein A